MASGSPTVHARMRATRGPLTHSRHFVEELPRTRSDLSRNHLQLQKEISKIEKQAKTAVTNLSSNQQALRMSLRNIEGRRKAESPLITRQVRLVDGDERPLLKRQSLFANNTCLTVDSTAEAYLKSGPQGRTRAASFSVDRTSDSATDVTYTTSELQLPAAPPPTTDRGDDRSPYVSTPFNVRKVVRTKLPKSFNSPVANQHHTAIGKSPGLALKSSGSARNLSSRSHDVLSSSRDTHSSADLSSSHDPLRLPPITSSHTVISAHHNTTDKATLKKASQLLGMSAVAVNHKSCGGATSFEQFYTDSGTNLIIVSPPPTPSGYRDEDHVSSESDDEDKNDRRATALNGDNSGDSLSTMFDQIKKCRYIRHYYPNGEKPPEAWY